MDDQLTAKEKRFCKEYADGKSAVDAYKIARLPLDQNNQVPASKLGETLIKPIVAEYIQYLRKEKETTLGLTRRQQRFCEEYVASGFKSASAAYQKVFTAKNDNVARVEASKLLKDLAIKRYIENLSNDLKKQTLINAKDVIDECKLIAFADIRDAIDIVDGDVYIKNVDALPSDVTKAISEVSSTNGKLGRTCKVRFHDKLKALEMLSKFSGLSSDLNEAIAVFRRYGYEVQQTEVGYTITDSFLQNNE